MPYRRLAPWLPVLAALAVASCHAPPAVDGPGAAPADAPVSLRLLALSNDDVADAVAIPGLPFAAAVDTAQTTQAAGDPAITGCTNPTGAGAWYTFTATEDLELEAWANVPDLAAGVDPGLLVFDGEPTEERFIGSCPFPLDYDLPGHIRARFQAQAGHTYYFHVGKNPGNQADGVVTFELKRFEPLTIAATIDRVATFLPGTATAVVTGTVTANKPIVLDNLDVHLFQRIGRIPIHGDSGSEFGRHPVPILDGRATWSRTVDGYSGTWSGGGAEATVRYFEANSELFVDSYVSSAVRLSGKRP